MNSDKDLELEDYQIEITKSGPQIIDSKKSYFLFDKNNKNIPRSPRRDCMTKINFNENELNKLNINNNINNINSQSPTIITFSIPESKLNETSKESFIEKIDKKITENIKNRDGFDMLLDDPDINQLLNK